MHALTIDAEDWAQLMCSYLGHTMPVSEQFVSSIERTLNMLGQHDTRATFFVVASQAIKQPAIVREIAECGHEVASHGWTHAKMHEFTPDSFREDLRRSIDTLEEITGQEVYGHRCPFFALMPEQSWAFEILQELGLEYDSSLTTLLWQAQKIALPDEPFVCALPGGREIVEVPALARKVGPVTARLIGGRGFRVMPSSFYLSHLREREEQGLPAMMYVHTYETTPDRLMRYVPSHLPIRERAKLVVAAKAFEVGMGRMNRALHRLLDQYEWAPMRDVVAERRQKGTMPRVVVTTEGKVVSDFAGVLA